MLEEASRLVFGAICHQDPCLLMEIDGRLLLLCPRCAGLHLGFLTAFTATTLWFGSRIRIAGRGAAAALVAAVGSMLVDWALGGQMGLFTPSIHSRLVTGLACGSALAILLVAYRSSLAPRPQGVTISLTLGQTVGVACFSVGLGVLAVSLSSWALLTLLCLASVFTNLAITVDTVGRMCGSRLMRCAAARTASHSRGGAV